MPIDARSTPDDISLALGAIKSINEVKVSVVTNNLSELEWTLTFLYDIGPLGSFSVDSDSLRCQSEDQTMLESESTIEAEAPLPLDHGSIVVSTDDSCGGLHLDEFSSMQFFSFSAESSLVSAGSYQLMLDNQSTSCIPFDASESQLKAAIQALDYVGDINVIATPSAEGVFEYKSFSKVTIHLAVAIGRP